MEEKHLNVKKVIITVSIVVFAFLIIFVSALLTMDSSKDKKKDKNLEAKEPAKIQPVTQAQEDDNEDKTSNNETDSLDDMLSQMQNQINNGNSSEKPSASTINHTSGGRIPVSNPDAIQLCKQAQSSSEKNIYLTFDDGPSPNITPQILSILKQYNVPATFFLLGSRAELYPELVRQEYNEGHYLANHGYSHQYSSIYSSVQSVIDEYNKCDGAIQTALGNPDYHTYLFRFPGGSSGGPYHDLKQQAKSTLEGMGIASTNWNCLNGDAEASGRTKQQLIQRLYDTAAGWNSLVVLMHDADDKQTTADALPEIIEHYQAEGYTFKNYYDIFQ